MLVDRGVSCRTAACDALENKRNYLTECNETYAENKSTRMVIMPKPVPRAVSSHIYEYASTG